MMNLVSKMHKLYAVMAAAFLVMFTGSVYCPAAESTPAVVLEDEAELLAAEDMEWLLGEAQTVADETGFNMILATCDDANGKTVREITDDYFDAYTSGEDGVGCIIDMDNREISFRAYGKAIMYLPDDRIDAILDEAYTYVAEGAYTDCLYAMIEGTENGYARGIPQDLEIYDEDTGKTYVYDAATGQMTEQPPLLLSEILIALGAALLVGMLVFFIIVGKYKLKWGTYRYDFHESGNITVTNREDRFINQVVTRRHIPQNTGGSSGGGGGGSRSSVSRGSSGRVSSGGSRKF